MIILRNNERLMAEIDRIAEVAGYLWTKGWAERNGGNISVNLTTLLSEEEKALLTAPLMRRQCSPETGS